MSDEDTSQPIWLYRLYDEQDQLLYIGTSAFPKIRWTQHRDEKPWWSSVHRKEVGERHPDRATAERAERLAIESERPVHNRTWNKP